VDFCLIKQRSRFILQCVQKW